jgi:hypothetical protein
VGPGVESGEELAVRVAVHRGTLFRTAEGAIYGLTINVAARLQTLAAPNEVVVSDEVVSLVGHIFETEAREPEQVRGVPEPVRVHRIVGEIGVYERPRKREGPLVNRTLEWERLQGAWNEIWRGETERASPVLIRGDAGVGKSYLASKLAEVAGDDGASVVELMGSAIFEDAGLYPVRRFMERASGFRRETDGVGRLALLRSDLENRGLSPDVLVPRLAPILGLEPETGYQPEPLDSRKLSEEIQQAAYTYVESCIGDNPSVVLAEDIHWFDRATRDLVTRLANTRRHCIVIMTARPGYLPVTGVEVIDLEPLSEQESGRLVDILSAETPIDDALRREVIARGDGIPLFIEELLANVRQGVAPIEDGIPARTAGTVPDLLYDLIAARLASPADVLPVATAAAVMGRDIDRRVLEAVLDLPSSDLDRALTILCVQGVLEPSDSTEVDYRFRHELLREVAYELAAPSSRRAIHGRVADTLASNAAGDGVVDWGAVAPHYVHADRAFEAADAYEKAVSGARMRGAFAEASGYLIRAIELLTTRVPRDRDRDSREVNLRLQHGYMVFSQDGPGSPVAEAEYERCLELTASDPFGDDTFNTAVLVWGQHLARGQLSKAREISEFTYRGLERREWYRNINIAAFGILDGWGGDYRTASDRLEMYEANRRREDEDRLASQWFNPIDPITVVLQVLGTVRFVMGDLRGTDRAFAAAAERAASMPFPQGPYSSVYVLSFEAWLKMELAQFEEAERRILAFGDLAAQHGFDGWTMVEATQRAVLAGLRAMESGSDAAELGTHAVEASAMTNVWKEFNVKFFLPFYVTVAGVLHAAAGNREAAIACYRESLDMAEETDQNFWQAETLRHLAALEPDVGRRLEGLRAARAVARRQHGHLFELRIALDVAELDRSEGRRLLTSALERFGGDTSYPEVVQARALVADAT